MPLVSVITPAHDSARFLGATIESVRAQTLDDWEMIIAENGSSDATPEIAARAAESDPRIRVLRMPRAVGPGAARNAALSVASARYVAFLDSDDLWTPAKLERQIAFARALGAAFTCTAYGIIDEEGRPIRRPQVPPPLTDYRRLLRHTLVGCLTVMLDRDQVGDVRMLDLPQHEDLTLWFAILKRGFLAHGLGETLAHYRVVSTSASASPLRSARRMWKVYRDIEQLPTAEAVRYFLEYAAHAILKRTG
ncbi:MAG: glycosyltransferase family 2 protein [Candidatus Eisenbacteria bacterium]